MKSNNKRGFTLVELLAVIVILAVLILLALPTVLRIMDNAKRNALKTEGLSLINAAETKYAAEGALGIGSAVSSVKYTGSSAEENGLHGYMDYKDGYQALICKSGSEFTINISNGTFKIVGLTKANANATGSSAPTVTEGTLTTTELTTCP